MGLQAALKGRIRRESGSGKGGEMAALANPGEGTRRASRMPERGVQGRQEGTCISSLPGFRCKGQHLGHQGQPKHFLVWEC